MKLLKEFQQLQNQMNITKNIYLQKKSKWGIYLMSLKLLLGKNQFHFDDKFYADCDIFIKLLQQWGVVHNLSGRLTK